MNKEFSPGRFMPFWGEYRGKRQSSKRRDTCVDEKMKQFGEKAKGFFSKVGKRTWQIIGAAVGVLVVAGIILAVVWSQKTYVPLFRELNSDDMTSILSYLQEQNVTDYKVEGNSTILVPDSQADILKTRVMAAGYPASSDNYTLYRENVGALATSGDRNTFLRLDLQERLAATIECFDNVREAMVYITPGKNNDFVLNRNNTIDASATVVVTTRNGRLTDEVAAAIRRAVNHAVEGLVFDNVTIEDQDGTPYIDTNNISNMSDASLLQMTLQNEQNALIRRAIIDLLTPVFGENNFSVGVNTTVDVSHTWDEIVRYYLPEYAEDGSTNGKGIIGKRVFSGELQYDQNNPAGGIPGTTENSDLSEYVESGQAVNGNETGLSVSGETDYVTSQDTTQRESNAGTITDCMVSVTINAQPGSINVDDWVAHVARAAGIDAEMQYDKVSVIATPFYVEPAAPGAVRTGISLASLPAWVLYAAIAGLALFLLILILVLILVRRSRKKRKKQEEELLLAEQQAAMLAAAEQQAALEAEQQAIENAEGEQPKTGANIMEIHTERSMELRRDVRAFAENNPEVAAYMIKSWLKGDDDDA